MASLVAASLSVSGARIAAADGIAASVDRAARALEAKLGAKPYVYAYTDDDGRIIHVERLQDVPAHLRGHARKVETEHDLSDDTPLLPTGLFASDADAADAAGTLRPIYRYRTTDGRTVYTNLPESVPAEQRAASVVDLARVPLNSELGTELNERMQTEHAKLMGTEYCEELRAAQDEPLPDRIWREQLPLVLCGLALLLFILITPSMVRKVGGAEWARTLSMAVPVLALSGLVMFVIMKTNGAISDLKTRAEPCQPQTWDALGDSDKPLVERAHLIERLKQQMSLPPELDLDDYATTERGTR